MNPLRQENLNRQIIKQELEPIVCVCVSPSSESNIPLYSIPHLSLTMTGFPVKLFKKGFGLTGIDCNITKINEN
jgi:hypothetical protein